MTTSVARARQLAGGAVGSIAVTLTIVIVIGVMWVGERYLSAGNLTLLGSFVAVPIIVGTFASFALLGGVVDLSIGSMVGFSAATFGSLVATGWPSWPAALVTLVVCAIFGAINGVAIVVFGGDAIASTLGMLTVLRGLTNVIVPDTGSIQAFNQSFFRFVNTEVGLVSMIFVIAVAGAVVATIIVLLTRLGRHIRAAGGDEVAAQRAGINVSRIRFLALVFSGLGAAIGGIFYVGQQGGTSIALGDGLEFQVYAALMIGGYSILRGGIGNPAGGIMGLLVVASVNNMLDIEGINAYYVNIVVGVLLIGAVVLDRLRGGDAFE